MNIQDQIEQAQLDLINEEIYLKKEEGRQLEQDRDLDRRIKKWRIEKKEKRKDSWSVISQIMIPIIISVLGITGIIILAIQIDEHSACEDTFKEIRTPIDSGVDNIVSCGHKDHMINISPITFEGEKDDKVKTYTITCTCKDNKEVK